VNELEKLHQFYDVAAKAYKESAEMPKNTLREKRERFKNLRYWKQRMDWLDKKLAEQGEQ